MSKSLDFTFIKAVAFRATAFYILRKLGFLASRARFSNCVRKSFSPLFSAIAEKSGLVLCPNIRPNLQICMTNLHEFA